MNILLLEDRGSVAYYLQEMLEEKGHTVFLANNVSRAKTHLEEKPIDCIIADLNIDSAGLLEKEKVEAEGGKFTGWIWLKYHVFPNRKDLVKQTIILTAYHDAFKNKLAREGTNANALGIAVIAKGQSQSVADRQTESLMNRIERIAKDVEAQK